MTASIITSSATTRTSDGSSDPATQPLTSSAASSASSSAASSASSPSPTHVDGSATPSETKGGVKWIVLAALAIMAGLVVWAITIGFFDRGPTGDVSPTLAAIPAQYDSNRSFAYLEQLCRIGPRPSASPGMKQQQDLLAKHFRDRGGDVAFQTFEIRHPEDGSNVPMANLIASWNTTAPKRFLICAHYDTRPFPDQDRNDPKGIFIGANDGGSGIAGLMELANQMDDLPADVGVDLVAFDGEEFIFQQGRDKYFLGSNFFAEKYKASPPAIPYQSGVLLDMIGDRELKIYYEVNSLRYAPKVAREIWGVARRLRVRAFVPKSRHEIQDDHLPLNQIAQIPTVDLIDFDYPREGFGAPSYWHTTQDIPANCSGQSIAAVVWVVHEWLKKQ